ncbi:MAG: hypothetical protein AAF466_10155 [Bacteroidota bacterium]
MMRTITFAIAFMLCAGMHGQEYFEGVIQYNVSYQQLNENISVEYMEQEMGTAFTAYVKEDRYSMIYNAKGFNGWMKIVVRLDKGYSMVEYEKSDTIIKTPFGPETAKLLQFERNAAEKREVMGELCESVTMRYEASQSKAIYESFKGVYYFSPKYKLNASLYKEYKESFRNLYAEETGAISLRNEQEIAPYFISIAEAVSIDPKEISDKLFEPNPNKVVVTEER